MPLLAEGPAARASGHVCRVDSQAAHAERKVLIKHASVLPTLSTSRKGAERGVKKCLRSALWPPRAGRARYCGAAASPIAVRTTGLEYLSTCAVRF